VVAHGPVVRFQSYTDSDSSGWRNVWLRGAETGVGLTVLELDAGFANLVDRAIKADAGGSSGLGGSGLVDGGHDRLYQR
jgi:hypothetical protein